MFFFVLRKLSNKFFVPPKNTDIFSCASNAVNQQHDLLSNPYLQVSSTWNIDKDSRETYSDLFQTCLFPVMVKIAVMQIGHGVPWLASVMLFSLESQTTYYRCCLFDVNEKNIDTVSGQRKYFTWCNYGFRVNFAANMYCSDMRAV